MDRETSTSRESAKESEASSSHICRSVEKSSTDMGTEEEVKVKVKVKGAASMEWEGEVKGDVMAMGGPFP